MDIATTIGLLGGISIVLIAMLSGGAITVFINIPSLLVVVCGSLMVVMVKFSMRQFISSIGIALKAFFLKDRSLTSLIEQSVLIAEIVRKGGVLSLDTFEAEDPLLQKGIQLLLEGHDPEVVNSLLKKDMALTIERHICGQRVFTAIGQVAPAMGMIGTLVGLVQMLSTMSEPSNIGPAMAIALLTTLYGAIIANMIALPIADKLALRTDEERIARTLVIDVLAALQKGQHPKVVEEMLQSYLPSGKRHNLDVTSRFLHKKHKLNVRD